MMIDASDDAITSHIAWIPRGRPRIHRQALSNRRHRPCKGVHNAQAFACHARAFCGARVRASQLRI
ncbi:hypothetical protein [Burkholderia sp. Ac-20353]|uniref:hypothetical protein n=1 Tax=Burkholderia sp. Ac-20353 TaxID=2703894 RepID=UPI00197B55CD|nr:hypothetical protein [Burkholderia sp. Ac-20353]MBN3791042.1 hypothetical protein [Burkholderia sp. Ac-20353]